MKSLASFELLLLVFYMSLKRISLNLLFIFFFLSISSISSRSSFSLKQREDKNSMPICHYVSEKYIFIPCTELCHYALPTENKPEILFHILYFTRFLLQEFFRTCIDPKMMIDNE